jgi:hypothetical protein
VPKKRSLGDTLFLKLPGPQFLNRLKLLNGIRFFESRIDWRKKPITVGMRVFPFEDGTTIAVKNQTLFPADG